MERGKGHFEYNIFMHGIGGHLDGFHVGGRTLIAIIEETIYRDNLHHIHP